MVGALFYSRLFVRFLQPLNDKEILCLDKILVTFQITNFDIVSHRNRWMYSLPFRLNSTLCSFYLTFNIMKETCLNKFIE